MQVHLQVVLGVQLDQGAQVDPVNIGTHTHVKYAQTHKHTQTHTNTHTHTHTHIPVVRELLGYQRSPLCPTAHIKRDKAC